MLAWGQNNNNPGETLKAYILETSLNIKKTHTIFSRIERIEKNELFPEGHALEGHIFDVNKVSLGYIYDFPKMNKMQWGIGGQAGVNILPNALENTYGKNTMSYMVFVRMKV